MPGEYAGSVGDFHAPKRYFLILFVKASVKRLLEIIMVEQVKSIDSVSREAKYAEKAAL